MSHIELALMEVWILCVTCERCGCEATFLVAEKTESIPTAEEAQKLVNASFRQKLRAAPNGWFLMDFSVNGTSCKVTLCPDCR